MARIGTQLKINRVKGPRLPYKPYEAEVRENEYAYLTTDGIAIDDGEGILYWVDTIVTTDAGGSIVYDNNAASGKVLSGAYATKKDHGVLNSWNPPKKYTRGVYINLTTSVVEICYKPLARNLRCTATIYYPPGTRSLVSRVTVVYIPGTRSLVSRVDVTYIAGTSDLVSRVTVEYGQASKNLISTVTVVYAETTRALVSRVTVRKETTRALVSQVTVTNCPGSSDLVCQVTIPYAEGTSNLVCRLYADQTP